MTISSTTFESAYVIDTNALLWYLTSDRKLSKRAGEIFAAAERGETRLYISSIVVAELYYANKKWQVFADFTKTYNLIKTKPYFRFAPFLADEVLDFDRDAGVPEMHDRIITGLARRLGVSLITVDPVIAASGIVTIEW